VGRNPWPTEPREKPDDGFFTSSWDAERATSDWVEFWRTTPRAAKELDRKVWLLHPRPDARLYVIDCNFDYDDLVEEFTHRYQSPKQSSRAAAPNWSEIAATGLFEAIHVTAKAVTAHRSPSFARAWAVESTLWFAAAFTEWTPAF
jgi:hypothetical protein